MLRAARSRAKRIRHDYEMATFGGTKGSDSEILSQDPNLNLRLRSRVSDASANGHLV